MKETDARLDIVQLEIEIGLKVIEKVRIRGICSFESERLSPRSVSRRINLSKLLSYSSIGIHRITTPTYNEIIFDFS